jgi:hypothetical protein
MQSRLDIGTVIVKLRHLVVILVLENLIYLEVILLLHWMIMYQVGRRQIEVHLIELEEYINYVWIIKHEQIILQLQVMKQHDVL